MTDRANRQILLTPGPLTTSDGVREAMLHDWGSRDGAFIAMTRRVRDRLVGLVHGEGSHSCVPIQGSGTFAVEAALGTLLPKGFGKALVLVNGAYGRRMVRICGYLGRPCAVYETAEDTAPDPAELARLLVADRSITHVAVVQCETTSGILNPVEAIADATAAAGRKLIVDAMSGFGAIDLDLRRVPCEGLIASANKCLEGVPGIGFAIIETTALKAAEGNAHSLSLDLNDQWTYMEKSGQWRFTPPTHVLAALDRAIEEHTAEGGTAARGGRYRRNCEILVDGLRRLGFTTFLPDALQAPIIVTLRMPADARFDFRKLYDLLNTRGIVIYPGAVTEAPTFRVGCIGRLDESDMRRALDGIADALREMGIEKSGLKPAAAA